MSLLKTLTINGVTYDVGPVVPAKSVTLPASAWVTDGDRHSQVVTVPGVTVHTKVDLQPTPEQLAEFHYKVLAFVAENDGGIITVYSIGDKPTGDHTIQITLTEVEGTGKIRGNTVGTTMPRTDFNQTDPKQADYLMGREKIVQTVNGVAPDENGNIQFDWVARQIKNPVLILEEKTVSSGTNRSITYETFEGYEEVAVTFDGVQYVCTPDFGFTEGDGYYVEVGNKSLVGGEDTGEPFLVWMCFKGVKYCSLKCATDGEHTMSITGYVSTYDKMPEEYLPDGLVRSVNGVTPDENGNVEITIPDSSQNVNQAEPAENDIPKVFFGSALPKTKDDAVMSFRYISKTADINCYCKTKAQGDSSMSYPKKNQTVKLYKDAECTKKLKVNFKGWGEQNKFCFKANWVDITHARNVVCARLWGDVVKSRSNYAELPELLRTSPNQGAIDGFPVKVYADGVYQGRYTLNIPKDAWMANMDDELDNHCILCGENAENGSSQFKAEALIDGTDWSDEIHDTVPESIKTRWNEVIRFVMNSTDEEFVANLGNYFDVPSLIDYYLFGIASCNYDGFKKNQLYYTYDGAKWYAGAYDMDLTWGNTLDGTEFAEHDRKWYMEYDWNRLYCRLDALFINELRERWNELKGSTLSVANVINHFERFTDICPPWLVAEDYAETTANGAFTAMPTLSTIQQIRDYAKKRHAWTNAYLGGHDFGCLMVYELNNTELNGTYGIDTGVNLNEMDAYTVLIDYTVHDISKTGQILDNALNGNGWSIQYSTAVAWGAFGAGTTGVVDAVHSWDTTDPTGIRVKVMVRKTADGVYQFRSSDMGYPEFTNFTSKVGTGSSNQNLWIGGNFYAAGVVNAFANATIHDCKVYDIALTDTAVLEYLQS